MDASSTISRGSMLTSKSRINISTVTPSSTRPPSSMAPHSHAKAISPSAEVDLTSRYRLESAIKASQSTAGKQPQT